MTISVDRLSGALGAEVRGMDLATLDDAGFATVQQLLAEHLVLFFPQQHLAPNAHRGFAARFGEMEIHPFIPKLDDQEFPEIVVLKSSQGAIADVWHTDVTFTAHPPIASVLHMQTLPEAGGDTMWANQYLAYEAISAPMRDLLDGLTAIHTAASFGMPDVQVEHPVVRRHPVTGRASLFVNSSFTKQIVQMNRAESTALLQYLFAHSVQPEFTCRRRWSEGDIGIWDNRCTQHYAIADYTGERVIHRVTILGDTPVAAADAPRWPADSSRRKASEL